MRRNQYTSHSPKGENWPANNHKQYSSPSRDRNKVPGVASRPKKYNYTFDSKTVNLWIVVYFFR